MLNDGRLIMGECSHFTWDGLPVFNSYLKSELPEIMLKRKREQGYEDLFLDTADSKILKWYDNLPEISIETLSQSANLIYYALSAFDWENFVTEHKFFRFKNF